MTLPQGPELILILAVVVLLFGAKKLPELGSSVGKTITNFKKGVAEGQAEDDEAEAASESGGSVQASTEESDTSSS